MKLTEHFSLEELAYTNNSILAEKNLKEANAHLQEMKYLALFAEQVRAFIKVPMIISSGYRCETLNKLVGGSKTSQHRLFQAIDFIPKNMSIDECFVKLKTSLLIYQQLIKEAAGEKSWIHISIGDKRENLIYKDRKYIKV